jgi:hypothetical protein
VHARAVVVAAIGLALAVSIARSTAGSLARSILLVVAILLAVRLGRSARRLWQRPPDFLLDERGITHVVSGRSALTVPWAAIKTMEERPHGPWWSTAGAPCVTLGLAGGGDVHLPADVEGLPADALVPILQAWRADAATRSGAPFCR